MSSRKRRAARRVRLAIRAYEQHWINPESDGVRMAFQVRHEAMKRRAGTYVMIWRYLKHLQAMGLCVNDAIDLNGVDNTIIAVNGNLIFRRIA